jgi:hypothetical protein
VDLVWASLPQQSLDAELKSISVTQDESMILAVSLS